MTDPWREVHPRPGLVIRYQLAPDRHGRMVLVDLRISGDAITADDLRRHVSIRSLENDPLNVSPPADPLTRPDKSGSDRHYKLVADHYRYYAARTSRPGAVMAEACGVPSGTVHNWIRESRRRGFLPPARRGRAG